MMTKPVLWTHRATVALIGLFVLAATADGFAQSWAGLYGWAVEHGLHGWKAMAFPGLIDLFILVGELGLFALALEAHRLDGGLAWFDLGVPAVAAVAGWSVSLAFNVGHVAHVWTTQVTAAAAPVASMLGLLVLLRTLHRFVMRPGEPGETTAPIAPADAEVMSDPATAPATADEDIDPAQALRDAVAAATRSAKDRGLTQVEIAAVVGTNRHRVREILKPAPATAAVPDPEGDRARLAPEFQPVASVNGHDPNGATDG
jgi:hypothetical protein